MVCDAQVLDALNRLVNVGDFAGARGRLGMAIACLGRLPAGAPWAGAVRVAIAALTNARAFASPGRQGHAITHLHRAHQAIRREGDEDAVLEELVQEALMQGAL
jgi:hypothetical protein